MNPKGPDGTAANQKAPAKSSEQGTPNENSEVRGGRWRRGRKTTLTTVLVVIGLVLVATGLGLGTARAIASLSGGPTSTSTTTVATGATGNTGSGVTAGASDGANTEQSGAPEIPQGGGAGRGFGAYNALACRDTNHCVAAGADASGHGVVGTSADGGSAWLNRRLPAGSPALGAIACANAVHCVAVGQGAILHSSDGGSTWSMQAPPVAQTTLTAVTCPSALSCLAVGASISPAASAYVGRILQSSDGGSTWSIDSVPANTLGMGAVTCLTALHCIAVGGGILTTADGGQTWQVGTVAGGTGVLRAISCSSATTCVALGPNPAGIQSPTAPAIAIMTTDGGTTWTSVSMPPASAALARVTCAAGGPCYAVGPVPPGTLAVPAYSSSDGGHTWQAAPSPGGLTDIADVACPSPTACMAVGHRGSQPAVGRQVNGVNSATDLSVAAP
jgi:photosystem II stability/assembly factor-like uncharacterized protein